MKPLLLLLFCFCCCYCTATATTTTTRLPQFKDYPIDKYVNTYDKSFQYQVISTQEHNDVQVTWINMTSQTWLNDKLVSQPVWYHTLIVAVPNQLKSKTRAMLYIGGGNNKSKPDLNNDLQILISKNTQSITAFLYQIPNQPLSFQNESVSRVEDAIIAYTWKMFLQTNDPLWLARFPMVKASVRAMDVVQEFVKPLGANIEKFIVGGASKRGWTAWLTAAVDYERVHAVIPIVIDVLNMQETFLNIYKSICAWPEAMQDYVNEGVTEYISHPQFLELVNQIDPLIFTERLTKVDKMIINAGNDQFFWPDDSTFSFHKIQGPNDKKRIRYVPNAEHSLAGTDVPFVVTSYVYSQLYDVPLPEYTFQFVGYTATGATLNVTIMSDKLPSDILLWEAVNPNARDFRINIVGKSAWKSTKLSLEHDCSSGNGMTTCIGHVENPETGYKAFMVELVYSNYFETISLPPLKFTTSAYITPNTYPRCDK